MAGPKRLGGGGGGWLRAPEQPAAIFPPPSSGQPVSFQELSAALRGQELVNYFQLVEAVETLRRSGHILPQEHQGEPRYALAASGREISSSFEDKLPPAVREHFTAPAD